MKHLLTNRVLYTIVASLSIFCLILVVKPSFMIKDNGDLKEFGMDENQTLVSFGFLTVIIPIIFFSIFTYFDVRSQLKQMQS